MVFFILFILGTPISLLRKISFPWGKSSICSHYQLSFTFLQSSSILSDRDYPPCSLFFLFCFQPGISSSLWLWEYHVGKSKTRVPFPSVLGCRNFFALARYCTWSLTLFPGLCGVDNYSHITFTFLLWGGGKSSQNHYVVFFTVIMIIWVWETSSQER